MRANPLGKHVADLERAQLVHITRRRRAAREHGMLIGV